MNIAIVDDEKIIREQICALVKAKRPDCFIETYASGGEFLTAGKKFEIVFLDIQMEGMDGIDTARKLRERSAKWGMGDIILIFITGSKEYVFDAFDVSAFHYLLKPIGEQKFTEVFERAAEEVKKRKKQKQEHIVIKTKNRCLTLKKNSIRYIENKGRKLEIHTTAFKEALEIYATMDELAGQLGENFYRCHRGYLVNMAYIAEYGSDSIRLMGGEEIYLTRRKHGEFVKAYMWYLQNGGNSCV